MEDILVLNLDRNFNPLGAQYRNEISFEHTTFPGGEPHITITADPMAIAEEASAIAITARLDSAYKMLAVKVAVDALRNHTRGSCPIIGFFPYLPGGRQDRVTSPGTAFTAKVYAEMIASLGLVEVFTFDAHSDVMPALIPYCTVISNVHLISAAKDWEYLDEPMILITPDAGAAKKSQSLMGAFAPDLFVENVQCLKTRDTKTNQLSGFQVLKDDFHQMPCVIVDDICDGGGTFMGLAKELKKKNAGDLHLIVSHGIFSKGFGGLNEAFKTIVCSDSFNYADLAVDSQVKVIPLEDCLQDYIFDEI